MTRRCIHQLINSRQREYVYGTGLTEVGEVDTYSPFATFLPHQDQVGKPLKVVCLSDEIDSQ